MAKKQKLTLTVDSGVVKTARELGINISEITEKILKGFTFEPEKGDSVELYEKYQEFFDTMLPLLKKYQTSVLVGHGVVSPDIHSLTNIEYDIYFTPKGIFWLSHFEDNEQDLKNIHLQDLLNTKEILANLMNAIAKSQESNKQKLIEIEMARRIIEAIADTAPKNPSTRLSEKKIPSSSKPKTRKKKGR